MKTKISLLSVLVAILLIATGCGHKSGPSSQVESLKMQLENSKKATQEVITQSEKEINSIKAQKELWESNAVAAYKDSLRQQQDVLAQKGISEVPISKINPNLEIPSWNNFSEGLTTVNLEKNQIRGLQSGFLACFGGRNVSNWELWESIKNSFKSNPSSFEKWFDSAEPALKKVKSFLGLSLYVSKETKLFLDKRFPEELAKVFEEVYLISPNSMSNCITELQRVSQEGRFKSFGYEPLPKDQKYWDLITFRLSEDFMTYVFHREYGPEAITTLKRLSVKIELL